MSWSEVIRRSLTALAVGLWLAVATGACGFQPLHANKPGGGNVAQSLASIAIPEPRDRLHQLVRNELILGGMSQNEGVGLYKLDFQVAEIGTDVLVKRSSLVERRMMLLVLTFKLMDGSKKPAFVGKNTVKVSYNRTASEFNNLRAQKDARERAAKRLAQILQTRLAAWLSKNRPQS
ncbi:MAG: hypothetical protein C0605_07640 [Hyphomicrobiales bacterium]|nr:MAG: hypothetical protein C0605_07640 [Hyphomicrobiales bacterium]